MNKMNIWIKICSLVITIHNWTEIATISIRVVFSMNMDRRERERERGGGERKRESVLHKCVWVVAVRLLKNERKNTDEYAFQPSAIFDMKPMAERMYPFYESVMTETCYGMCM